MEGRPGAGCQRTSSAESSVMSPRRMSGVASSSSRQGRLGSSMLFLSYDVLAAIDMDRVACHPISSRVAEGGDAARHILGGGEAAGGIAQERELHELLVTGGEAERGGIRDAGEDGIGRSC